MRATLNWGQTASPMGEHAPLHQKAVDRREDKPVSMTLRMNRSAGSAQWLRYFSWRKIEWRVMSAMKLNQRWKINVTLRRSYQVNVSWARPENPLETSWVFCRGRGNLIQLSRHLHRQLNRLSQQNLHLQMQLHFSKMGFLTELILRFFLFCSLLCFVPGPVSPLSAATEFYSPTGKYKSTFPSWSLIYQQPDLLHWMTTSQVHRNVHKCDVSIIILI